MIAHLDADSWQYLSALRSFTLFLDLFHSGFYMAVNLDHFSVSASVSGPLNLSSLAYGHLNLNGTSNS